MMDIRACPLLHRIYHGPGKVESERAEIWNVFARIIEAPALVYSIHPDLASLLLRRLARLFRRQLLRSDNAFQMGGSFDRFNGNVLHLTV